MQVTKISSKFQTVVPGKVRELLGLRPGSELGWLVKDGTLFVFPIRTMKELFGSLRERGITSEGIRDHNDRY
jgi:AbrB family looped-hinge helix DNA binding protein